MAGPEIALEYIFDPDPNLPAGERIKYACLMSILAAYDKKLLREEFMEVVFAAFNLSTTTIRHMLMLGVEEYMNRDLWTPEKLQSYLTGYKATGTTEYAQLYELAKKIVACSSEGESVH